MGAAPRWPRVTATAIVLLFLLSLALPLVQGTAGGDGPVLEDVALILGFGIFAGLGALLVLRRPSHPMGWIFASIGLLVSFGQVGDALATPYAVAGAQPPGWITGLAWINTWYWYVMLAEIVIAVPLLFPDGRLPSRRWRIPALLVACLVMVACVQSAFAERIEVQLLVDTAGGAELPPGVVMADDGRARYAIDNPMGLDGLQLAEDEDVSGALLITGYVIGAAMGVAAIAVRFRRSRGTPERQQLKWFFLAGAGLVLLPIQELVPIPDAVGNGAFAVVMVALPISIALSILRYRLYDIDRIVSRTVAYVLLTGLLAAVYGAVVIAGQALVGPEDAPDVLVAGATLLAAGLFGPARRRLQTIMDRRFNRAAYDARQVVDGFGVLLRDEIDTTSLTQALTGSVDATVHPSASWVWLPPSTASQLDPVITPRR